MLTKDAKPEYPHASIYEVVGNMLIEAHETGKQISSQYNGKTIIVGPSSSMVEIVMQYQEEETKKKEAELAEIRQQQEKAKKHVDYLIANHNFAIEEGKEEDFQKYCSLNSNKELGVIGVTYIKAYGIALQLELQKGNSLSNELLERVSNEIDYFGNSGLSKPIFYLQLKQFWKHGHLL